MPDNRLTLVVTPHPRLRWDSARVLVVDVLPPVHALTLLDVERIILDDGATTADDFLRLLSSLPPEIAADVMLVREDGGAFLSASGRGGDRVLYELAPHDVIFYAEANHLTANGQELALTA